MKIQVFSFHSYSLPLTNHQMRSGAILCLTDEKGNKGFGEIAPLPKWSKESLEESIQQLNQIKEIILSIDWSNQTCLYELARLALFSSVSFGLESALLSLLSPLSNYSVPSCALLMGSSQEILSQAELRYNEGFTYAKLKVNQLAFDEATALIYKLKKKFHLRIDVNRAWNTTDSLRFFSQFPLDAFDYVEEPFRNPHDLAQFSHPLAIDESFPSDLSLKQLESLPNLKALIYKPTIQGGMINCLPLVQWTKQKDVSLVLSSSFESDIGLTCVASLAQRLSLPTPVGIGTYHFLKVPISSHPLYFLNGWVHVPSEINGNSC